MSRRSEAARRGWQRHREKARLEPTHVARWRRDGEIAEQLRPILEARAEQASSMIQDLGGVDAVTSMERAVIDAWLMAQVAADAEFARFLRDPQAVPERLMTALNSSRAALSSLGLNRRSKELAPFRSVDVQWSQGESTDD